MKFIINKSKLIQDLKIILEEKYILTSEASKYYHQKGYRYGIGEAFTIVKPGNLLEFWKVLELCVDADFIVIMQAANTGLTGGSTPNGTNYDRPIVIINTMRIDDIHFIDEGKQIIALPGSTLFDLENKEK